LADAKARALVIAYGQLFNDILSFLIVGFAVFILETDESAHEGRAASRTAADPRLPVLRDEHSAEGDTVPALHVGRAGEQLDPE
jgi:large-conductance mechanosensitive channel